MAFMQAKTCCCGCSLRTGTMIMVFVIGIPCAMFFFSSVINPPIFDGEKDYSEHIILAEIFVLASCLSAVYSIKKNERMYLIPFMIVIILLFIVALFVSLAPLLMLIGFNSLFSYVAKAASMEVALEMDRTRGDVSLSASAGPKFNFMDSIGPFTVLMLMLSITIIAVFLHFTKVVCSLFAEMGNPNGIVLQATSSPMSPAYNITMSSPSYNPVSSPYNPTMSMPYNLNPSINSSPNDFTKA